MSVVERVRTTVEPLLAARDVGLYDLELQGHNLRILVDTGDLDVIEDLTRAISHALDDADPIEGRYTLEVSSRGLERPLRTPAHFAGAVGDAVSVKTRPDVEGDRRVRGTLTAAGADDFTVRADDGAERTLRYDDVERARTVFEWGPPPKPGKRSAPKSTSTDTTPTTNTTEKATR